MDEELKHIDLIDKYLSETLTAEETVTFNKLLEEDSDFEKEVAIYRQLYKGIEQVNDANLKEKLAAYYDEFHDENKQTKKGLYRRLFIYGGSIAASLIIGALIFFREKPLQQDPVITDESDPPPIKIEKIDTLKKKAPIPVPKVKTQEEQLAGEEKTIDTIKSLEKSPYKNTQLSFGGVEQLPAEAIRSIVYPVTLQYTFDGRTLLLYGDTSIASLQLQLIKNKENLYILNYKGTYYSLRKTTEKEPLTELSSSFNTTKIAEEEITIIIKGVEEISKITNALTVSITGNKTIASSYLFEENEKGKHLIIDGDFNTNTTKLYLVQEGTSISYFLKAGKQLFKVNPRATRSTPLEAVNVLTNKQTQLFRDDRTLSKTVYLIKE